MRESDSREELLEFTVEIVEAHVSNNAVAVVDLSGLIETVHETLSEIGVGLSAKGEPAVSIKKSVRHDHIVCLEDGGKYKMLKRHLRTAHDITPEGYRKRWGLPGNYPLVAPKYAEMRSKLAKKIGLGRKPGTKIKKVRARRKA